MVRACARRTGQTVIYSRSAPLSFSRPRATLTGVATRMHGMSPWLWRAVCSLNARSRLCLYWPRGLYCCGGSAARRCTWMFVGEHARLSQAQRRGSDSPAQHFHAAWAFESGIYIGPILEPVVDRCWYHSFQRRPARRSMRTVGRRRCGCVLCDVLTKTNRQA